MLKLKLYVRYLGPCGWFCIQKCSPPSRTKILSGFLLQCWLHLGSSTATLWLRRSWGCVEGYMASFWTMLLRHSQNQIKNRPKTQKGNSTTSTPCTDKRCGRISTSFCQHTGFELVIPPSLGWSKSPQQSRVLPPKSEILTQELKKVSK